MSAPGPEAAEPRRRRMAPDKRREHILDAARTLFAEHPYASVTTGEIAEAADVARSLVHHYFGGIREVFLAVVAAGAPAMADVRTAGPETPFEERTAYNISALLDVIGENRETWLAVAGHGAGPADPQIRALVLAAKEANVDRTLAANTDVVTDTPLSRFALRCFVEFSSEATRAWLVGERTREETEALLLTAGRDLMLHTIPALERRPPGG